MSYSTTGHKTPAWKSDLQQALLPAAASRAAVILSVPCCCDGNCINTEAEWGHVFSCGRYVIYTIVAVIIGQFLP